MKILFIMVLFMMGCAECPTEEKCVNRMRENAERIAIERCLNNAERLAVFSGKNGAFIECREIPAKGIKNETPRKN